jgi:hypothetical protein
VDGKLKMKKILIIAKKLKKKNIIFVDKCKGSFFKQNSHQFIKLQTENCQILFLWIKPKFWVINLLII